MANYPKYLLTGKTPAGTYNHIVQFNSESSSFVDGLGNDLPFEPIEITASVSVTASNSNTSSFAISASWAPFTDDPNALSASWASQSISASWAPPVPSVSSSYTDQANFAVSASWASQSLSASWASDQISCSWSSQSLSASWAPTSITYPLTVLPVNQVSYSIDFLAGQYFQLDTTGSEFTFGNSTNVVAVRNASVYITAQSGSRTIVFHPSWIVLGNFPTTITHQSASVLSLTTFSDDDTGIVAAFASKV